MEDYAFVPDSAVSLVKGIPLADEPGIGVLTVTGWLREITLRFGPRTAIVEPRANGDDIRWTYTQLWDRSVDVARALVAEGLGKGERVAILATNRAEFITVFMGTVLAGGIACPLSTFATAAELAELIAASACSILIVEPQVLDKDFVAMIALAKQAIAAPHGIASARYPFLRLAVALDRTETDRGFVPWSAFLERGKIVARASVEARLAMVSPADCAGLFFSSGSTGKPKGILNAHLGIAVQLWRWPRILGLDSDVRAWPVNGFFWSAPFGMGLGALSVGGSLTLLPVFDAGKAIALIESERVTCPMGWPHQWAQIVSAPEYASADLSSLHYLGAENPIREHSTVETDWPEATRIYGNTETFTLSTGYCSGTSEDILQGSHGFPMPGMTIKVVDPADGKTLPMGERGELAVKGSTLMLGYAGVPNDEILDHEGFFATGDGGYVDSDGRVFWEGRLNDIIKTGGANVSPVEVDAVLLQCPGVKLVKTIGLPHPLLGEIVVACVVAHAGTKIDETLVRTFAKEQLAAFKVPRRVIFLSEENIAQTGSAKVKTGNLRALAATHIDIASATVTATS